ncbi:O-antigen ligase family protein [Caproiciproducens galactitolivorans]|nr:O-antigen ligase family protein [Caproiciproducens galactitolivorans]
MIKFDFRKLKLPIQDIDSMLVLLLAASVFVPFYFSVVVTCGIAIMTMINCKVRTKAFSSPYSKFLLGFLIIPFFISAIYNNYWGMVYAIVILAAATCAFYVRSVMNRSLFNKVMDLTCIASLWCVAIAVYQKVTAYGLAPRYRPVSVFHNANCYGMMIEFIIIIAIYRIFTNKQKKNFYLAVIELNLIGLYLSASCSAFIATACAVMTMLVLKNRYALAVGLVCVAAAFVTVGAIFPSIFPRGLEAIDSTCGQRLSIWTTALRGITRHPFFGTGALSYQMICEQLGGYKTYHCHNLLLDTLLNFGFVGFGAIGIYCLAQLKLLLLRFKNNIGMNMNILFTAALVATAVHGMTDVTILWIQTGLLFIFMYSAMGIGSECLESQLRLPSLVPDYAEKAPVQPVYLKN